ncbi:LuxR family two component transcriptional regulator [Stenotrophomonas rhizophila]|uniref:LuxR family two component transcriptional regulator n=1 Tax=Stenotrophomonas rhizophila TaxID=216778 RepID=A0A498CS52_9GAMM|nr:response regulator transcription factor [Stenotrophomonas rhizophila]RLK56422.1 LuxR family two component transcriptional regulator [Stenotrophomonas rhizophila]
MDLASKPPESKQFGSLVLADGHTLVAEGMAKLLESRFSRIWIASTAARFQELVSQVRPTLVITDLYLPGASCIALMDRMLKQEGAPAFIFLPAEAGPDTVTQAMTAGAKGFLHRRCSSKELYRAIDCVMSGCTYVAASFLASQAEAKAAAPKRRQAMLTAKQLQVLEHVALGMRAQDVAQKLHLSTRTVESHKRAIMRQLDVGNSLEMVRVAREEGILT